MMNSTEWEILKDSHKFIREEEDPNLNWNDSLAKKYYDSLYKEFVMCDLKHYKSGNVFIFLFFSSFSKLLFSLLFVGELKMKSFQVLVNHPVPTLVAIILQQLFPLSNSHSLIKNMVSARLPLSRSFSAKIVSRSSCGRGTRTRTRNRSSILNSLRIPNYNIPTLSSEYTLSSRKHTVTHNAIILTNSLRYLPSNFNARWPRFRQHFFNHSHYPVRPYVDRPRCVAHRVVHDRLPKMASFNPSAGRSG